MHYLTTPLDLSAFPQSIVRLTSHGGSSSLIEHTYQVTHCAKEKWELIGAICHDIGKAHPKWQTYAKTFTQGESPFNHAVAGGLISYFILKELGESEENALASLHSISAHHSELSNIDTVEIEREITEICSSPECLLFANKLLNKWADVSSKIVESAFNNSIEVIDPISTLKGSLEDIDSNLRFNTSSKARSLLGRLCLMDHRSAAYQHRKVEFKLDFPGNNKFSPRAKTKEFDSNYKIDILRKQLRENSVSLPKDKKFYILSAPTGLGKTNAALCLAEEIVAHSKKERIIYTSALVSIGDQTFGDYLGEEGDNAQIWNYKRKETATAAAAANEKREGLKDSLSSEIEELSLESPFSRSYNVTTFNQVLYSLLHPNRHYAITSLCLRNAVLIFDEYHALPTETLQALLEVLDKRDDLQSIFLSATPSHATLWEKRSDNLSMLNPDFLKEMESSDLTKSRRVYIKGEKKNAHDIAELINSHAPKDGDLLVMINLIGKGTVPVAKLCGLKADPWDRGGVNEQGSKIYWLDGTLPPSLRYETIQEVKKNRGKGVILLCTQVIQAGVDLEFDIGYGDFFSFISAIQTAGRVGRNTGNKNKFYCFTFNTEKGSTRDVLTKIGLESFRTKYPSGWEGNLAKTISKRLQEKIFLEKEAFDKWDGTVEEDYLRNLNNNLEGNLTCLPPKILPLILSPSPGYIGLNLSSLSTLTDLYGNEKTDEIILIPESLDINQLSKRCEEDPKYRSKLKQDFTVRAPKEYTEMLLEEGFSPTGVLVNEVSVWKKAQQHL